MRIRDLFNITLSLVVAGMALHTAAHAQADAGTSPGPPPGPPPQMPVEPLDLPAGLTEAQLAEELNRRLSERAAEDRFSGVVLLARNGRVLFNEGFGEADRAAGRKIDADTMLDVGSITKLITRTAVAQLLQRGQLALDDRIGTHLPDYPNATVAASVTVGQLLEHSAGLGNIFNERWMRADRQRFLTPGDFFELFADEPLRFEPGTAREYSNAGYIVLGAIIEAVSGQSYSDYVEKHIFTPAGMTRSGLELRDGRNPAHAIGYAPLGPGGELKPNISMLPVQGCPAGSSMHTAADLLRFDRALRGGVLLDPEWTAWVFESPQVLENGRYAIGVAGGGPGVSAGLESDGEVTVIVLSNFDPPTGDALALELFAVLSDLSRRSAPGSGG